MSAHEIIADKDFDLNRFFGWVKAHARFEILENTEEDHIFVYKLYGNLISWSIRHRNAGDQTFYIVHPQVMIHYEAMLSGKDFPTKERLRLGKTKSGILGRRKKSRSSSRLALPRTDVRAGRRSVRREFTDRTASTAARILVGT